ncbi:hypothetical protein GCM10010461_17340 [Microbacterium aurantiacum]
MRCSAEGPNLSDDLLRRRVRSAGGRCDVVDDDARSPAGEFEAMRTPQAPPTASDDGDAPVKTQLHQDGPSLGGAAM